MGIGYLTIAPETSRIGPGITKALDSAQTGADKSGRGLGSKLAGGLGSTLKVGALAAGGVAGVAIGTALSQGMGRLVAIDDAKGKLAGLGHDAEGIATIMDSALASVKGTAFGLGDAATIAASAVAAGIKPGEELTKYLSLTGDAATIAGTSLEEMGSVINKVTTSGTAYTDNLNQLADRGIPIFQWLQDEYGVTADGLSDMVKKGEVDAGTFRKVIEENIGGAALKSGDTLRGSFENMKAALGRVGESALKPFAQIAKDSFGGTIGLADSLAPKVEAMSTRVATGLMDMVGAFKTSGSEIDSSSSWAERFGATLRTVTDGIQGVWSILAKGQFDGAKMTFGLEEDSKAVDVLFSIREGAIGAYQAISRFFSGDAGQQVSSSLTSISTAGGDAATSLDGVGSIADKVGGFFSTMTSALGSAGGSLLDLGGDSATVAAAGIGAVSSAMGFLADNTELVAPLLVGVIASMGTAKAVETGYQAAMIARTIMMPAQIAAQVLLTRSMDRHTASMTANSIGMRAQMIAQQGATATSGFYRTALDQQTAAAGRAAGASAAAAGAGGVGALRTAAGGLTSFLMGPFGAALAVGGIVLTGLAMLKGSHDEAAAAAEAQNEKEKELGRTLDENTGKITDSTRKDIATTAQENGDLDRATGYGLAPSDVVDASTGTGDPRAYQRVQSLGLENVRQGLEGSRDYTTMQSNYAEAGVSQQELQNAILAKGEAWDTVTEKITAYNNAQKLAETGISLEGPQGLIDTFSDVNESAVTLTQNVNSTRAALDAGAAALQSTNTALNGTVQLTEQGAQFFRDLGATIESVPSEKEIIVRGLTEDAQTKIRETGRQVEELPDGSFKVTADTTDAEGKIQTFVTKPRQVSVNIAIENPGAVSAAVAEAERVTGRRINRGQFATGGRLPTSGPGTEMTDGFLAVAGNGAPIARVDAGEWVINGNSSEKYDRELAQINAGTFPKLPGYEEGGKVGAVTSKDLLDFVNGSQSQPLTGALYDWGKVKWGDCSGAMSAIARFAVGLAPFADRFATATQGAALSAMGFLSGLGGPGDLRFGWMNGGPGGGHTAGTLPDGTNVEMGGSYGGGMVGGTVGANAAQFTDHAFLPIAGGGSMAGSASGRSSTSRKRPEWTDKQQLDLESAIIAVTQAEEARTKVENAFAEGKKSQADLDQANSKVERANQRVTDLQGKKDEVAAYVEDGPAPQAPGLSKAFTDSEIARLDAQLAVESANERRNEIYDNADSSDLEKQKADAELYSAQEKLKTAGSDPGAASDLPGSWSELGGNFARDFVMGQLEDALGVFGIPNELPGAAKAALMLGDALRQRDTQGAVTATDPGSASRSDIMADSPVLYDPAKGPEQWAPVAEEALTRTGAALSSVASTIESIATKSGGNPANLLGLSAEAFGQHRDPALPDDPTLPLSNLVAGLRMNAIKGYFTGGPVTGPSGKDVVPAMLTAREFVVNSRDAVKGPNPSILQAMNSGANLALGTPQQTAPSKSVVYNMYGITDAEDAIRRVKIKERQDHLSVAGTMP